MKSKAKGYDPSKGYILPEEIEPDTSLDVCVPVPNEIGHILAFLGQLDALAKWTAWERDPLKRGAQAAAIWREVSAQVRENIDNELGCEGGMIEFRQNPADACQLQYRNDSEDAWSLAFDYGLCIPEWAKALLDIADNLQQNLWGQATSPTDINPYAPSDTWVHTEGDDTDTIAARYQSLCYAAREAINIACEMLIAAYEGRIQVVDLAQTVLGIIAAIATALGATVWLGFGLGLAVAALEIYQGMVAGDVGILSDEEVREELACAIFEGMQAKPVSEISFINSFIQDNPCFSGDTARAYDLVKLLFINSKSGGELYAGFVNALGEGTLASKAGLLNYTCVCAPRTWQYCLPLYEWWQYTESVSPVIWGCAGQTNNAPDGSILSETLLGRPFWENAFSGTFSTIGRRLRMYVPAQTTVTAVQYDYIFKDEASGNTDGYAKKLEVNGQCVAYTAFPPTHIAVSGLSISGEMMEMLFNMQNSGGINNPPLGIVEIRISGTGVPLFGICDNC